MINSLTILSPSLAFIKKYYTFISCIWTTEYYGPGEFEVVIEYSPENLSFLNVGHYIVKNDTKEIGVIEKVKYNLTPQSGATITASGRMAISLLDRRLIYAYDVSTYRPSIITYCAEGGNVEDAARSAVYNQAISPPEGGVERVINKLRLGIDRGYTETANKRVSTYQNLYNALTAFLATKNMAHRIVYNAATSRLLYEVYKGTDRSATMVFSRQLENLLSFTYEIDRSEWKNFIYIGGDGEGVDRFVTSTPINDIQSGTERRESFYSANSPKEDNVSDADYAKILQNEAKQECRDLNIIKSVNAELDLVNSGFVFGEDYNVGDIITIRDITEYNPRITTVIESQTPDGYAVDVEFNEDAPAEEES